MATNHSLGPEHVLCSKFGRATSSSSLLEEKRSRAARYAMDSTPMYFAPDTADSGPLYLQGMSPNALEGASLVSGRPMSFGPQQMPIGSGSTAAHVPARQPMTNGVAPQATGQGSSQLHGTATSSGLMSGAVGGVEGESFNGAVTGPADDGVARLRVGGRVEQASAHQPTPPTTSMPLQQPPHPPSIQQQQQQRLPAMTTPTPADESRRMAGPQPQTPVDMSPGARLTVEAQRAMAQLASQRTALVQALQTRATRAATLYEGHAVQGDDQRDPAQDETSNEEVVWYSRLHGFLRRRVVEPVPEQVENLRRATPIASPQSTWMSAPSSPEQVLDPDVRQAMAQWTERRTFSIDLLNKARGSQRVLRRKKSVGKYRQHCSAEISMCKLFRRRT